MYVYVYSYMHIYIYMYTLGLAVVILHVLAALDLFWDKHFLDSGWQSQLQGGLI